MISSESWMLEIGMSSSMSGEKKRDYARDEASVFVVKRIAREKW